MFLSGANLGQEQIWVWSLLSPAMGVWVWSNDAIPTTKRLLGHLISSSSSSIESRRLVVDSSTTSSRHRPHQSSLGGSWS
nr:hypothetical protein CFP56_14491 [Quercus suber]